MPSRRPNKKNKIMLLLKEGETSPTIIANKVGCDPAYVNVVRNKLLRAQRV